jgi:outer membrane protein
LLLLVAMSVFSPSVNAQVKIGFVNSAKILQEYPEAVDANRRLDEMGKRWQAELETMSKTYQQRVQDYQKKEALMKEDEKKAQQEDLLAQERKIYDYRQQKFCNEGDLAVTTDSLLRPIKQKVMRVIESVAKDQKIQFMFDRNEQIVVLLYGEPKYDYTNLVIDKLKRGK